MVESAPWRLKLSNQLNWMSTQHGQDQCAYLSVGTHTFPPPGDFCFSHSNLNRLLRNKVDHAVAVGAWVQAPSRPLVMVSSALPWPHLFFQPSPCSSIAAAAGSGPTQSALRAPWTFCPGNVYRRSTPRSLHHSLPFGRMIHVCL